MIENLSYKQTITIISQYDTEGHAPLLVLADDFEKYVLKFPKNASDKNSIVKEFLCHYLLKYWSISTPFIAALSVPHDLLVNSTFLSRRDKVLIGDNICFGSKLIPNAVELNDFIEAKNKTSQKRVLNSEDIFKIALFDIWVENEDRKPTNNNILLDPNKKGFILNAIDHAFTFSTLNFNELNFPPLNYSYNESILYSTLAKSIIDNTKLNREFYTKSEEMFYLCIQNVEDNFSKIVDNTPENLGFSEEDRTILAEFLFNKERNVLVFQEFCYILNSISK
jgi:hypothetical protein